MSGGLVPSKSTIYVSNLPFSLTNSDLHKIFEKYGKVVKVTVVKDKKGRSKGVAFVLFLERDSAHKCVRAINNSQMFGRTLKCSVAKDNGRASEFIKRKEYKDKSRCYECGEEGHLSYACPKNLLGDREPPPKKKRKNKDDEDQREIKDDEGDQSDTENPYTDSLSAAISFQQSYMMNSSSNFQDMASTSSDSHLGVKRKKYKKDAYFSDEEELD